MEGKPYPRRRLSASKLSLQHVEVLLSVIVAVLSASNALNISRISNSSSNKRADIESNESTPILAIASFEMVFGVIKYIVAHLFVKKVGEQQQEAGKETKVANFLYIDKNTLIIGSLLATLADAIFGFFFGLGLNNIDDDSNINDIFSSGDFGTISNCVLFGIIGEVFILLIDIVWVLISNSTNNDIVALEAARKAQKEADSAVSDLIGATEAEVVSGVLGVLQTILCGYYLYLALGVYNKATFEFSDIGYGMLMTVMILDGIMFLIFFLQVCFELCSDVGGGAGLAYGFEEAQDIKR